jgi:hypothetical protein
MCLAPAFFCASACAKTFVIVLSVIGGEDEAGRGVEGSVVWVGDVAGCGVGDSVCVAIVEEARGARGASGLRDPLEARDTQLLEVRTGES